nr:uncharacterized protein LOC127307009 [Lolium perenne]
MATALGFAARKICSRALERPAQQLFSTAASAVVKEEQRMLLPRISHGGSSLRRFSSSEAPNLLNNNKHLPCEAKSGLSKRIEEKKHELLDLLRQMEGDYSKLNEPKELQHLLQRSNERFLATHSNVTVGAILAAAVTVSVGYKFVLGRKEK